MGLSSANSSNEEIKLCVFDLKRGQNEGQELDKILFFYPIDLSFSAQLSVIGLSEGLITFTRIFSPEAACEVIEAEMHTHVFFEAEPDIWMVMVVEKSNETESIWRIDGLRKVLKEVHSLFVMFHGSVRAMLDREPGGELIRSHLYYFILDYLGGFLNAKKLCLPNFRDSLKERGTVQMLTIGREVALDVQVLVKALESCYEGVQCYSMILYHDLLVSSTLSPDDTVNLFTYSKLRLSPHALYSGMTTWSDLWKGYTTTAASSGSTGSVLDLYYGSHETSHTGSRSDNVIRPLKNGKWSRGNDGFINADVWGADAGSCLMRPSIWLNQTGERMYLCCYQHKSLTLIFLIPATSLLNEDQGILSAKQHIIENVSLKVIKLEEKLSRGWGGENAYHVSGYRYLVVDSDRNTSRASPPGKVTTLTKESLVALSRLREDIDFEKSRSKWNGEVDEKDMEVCIRARNNAWVICRITRGKELYMVLEKANETLLYASDAIHKFSDRYCNGAFSVD